MAFEIDYIPVGDGDRSGDAIALRFGDLSDPQRGQRVIIIDGGFEESGGELVKHINKYYGTNRVDLVISTHPDSDHASGLKVVLEEMDVGTLLMHKPWEHAAEIKSMFKNGRISASGLEAKLEKSLQDASDLETLATEKGIPVYEPFQGLKAFGGVVHILGPAEDFYQELLPHFRGTPEPANSLSFWGPIKEAAEKAVKWIRDNFSIDLLDDDEDTTSAENNTSAIILFHIDGHKLLFTGDAGKTGLHLAVDYAEGIGIGLSDLGFLDVPHHGSKRNISSKLLGRIKSGTAFVAASRGAKKHPSKKVTNALQKHGAKVYVTRGIVLNHHFGGIDRGWGNASPEPFHEYVED